MKPRTKLQRRIVAASGRLPEITPAQLHWGYAHFCHMKHSAPRGEKSPAPNVGIRGREISKSTVPSARIAACDLRS